MGDYSSLIGWYKSTYDYDFEDPEYLDSLYTQEKIDAQIKEAERLAKHASAGSKKPLSGGQFDGLKKALRSDEIKGMWEAHKDSMEAERLRIADEYISGVESAADEDSLIQIGTFEGRDTYRLLKDIEDHETIQRAKTIYDEKMESVGKLGDTIRYGADMGYSKGHVLRLALSSDEIKNRGPLYQKASEMYDREADVLSRLDEIGDSIREGIDLGYPKDLVLERTVGKREFKVKGPTYRRAENIYDRQTRAVDVPKIGETAPAEVSVREPTTYEQFKRKRRRKALIGGGV